MTDGGYSRTEAWNLQLQAQITDLQSRLAAAEAEVERLTRNNDRLTLALRKRCDQSNLMTDDEAEILHDDVFDTDSWRVDRNGL